MPTSLSLILICSLIQCLRLQPQRCIKTLHIGKSNMQPMTGLTYLKLKSICYLSAYNFN